MRGFVLAAACMGALLLAGASQARTYGDLNITAQTPAVTSTSTGYAEYLVTIRNTSTSTARRVTLELPNSRWGSGWGESISRISRSVDVPAGSTVEVPLLQPALSVNGDGLRVTIDGERQDDGVALETGFHGSMDMYYGDTEAALFCSQSIRGNVIDVLRQGLEDSTSVGSGYRTTRFSLERSELAVAQWSPRWLAYTRFAAVVVANSDLATMPQPVRDAIDRYVHCGGSLVVLGEVEAPEAWGAAGPIVTSIRRARGDEIEGVSLYQFGLGQCMVFTGDAYGDWGYDAWDEVASMIDPSYSPGSYPLSPEDANAVFPVVEDQGVPARGLLIMMVLFAIIIGPVNLVVLHRLRRRLWTLCTVPAMSLLFSATVFGYAMFSEGWGAVGRSVSVTLLDENTMQASTIGFQGFYCPLTPSDGLHFERNTEVAAQVANDYYRRSGSSARTIDWTHDQHLASGWVSSRVPAHFRIRRSETRRERLEVSRNDDGSYTVVNGLGARIIELQVADTAGHIYSAGPIPAGGSATLVKRAGPPQDADQWTMQDQLRMGSAWSGLLSLGDGSSRNLRVGPGTYYAVLEGAPFMEIGLDNLSEHRSTCAVIGLMREPIDGS